jgi:hypothetical protein
MESLEKLKEIIRNNRMSTRPEFYSGRGAILCDLNGDILEGIYKGIEKEFGKMAARNFVKMVKDVKVLSATTFLEELYNLHYSGWKYYVKKRHASGVSVPKNKDGEYDETSAMMGMVGIMTAMTSGGRDETMSIKGFFLRQHGVKPVKKTGYEYHGNGNCIFWG